MSLYPESEPEPELEPEPGEEAVQAGQKTGGKEFFIGIISFPHTKRRGKRQSVVLPYGGTVG